MIVGNVQRLKAVLGAPSCRLAIHEPRVCPSGSQAPVASIRSSNGLREPFGALAESRNDFMAASLKRRPQQPLRQPSEDPPGYFQKEIGENAYLCCSSRKY